MEQPPNRLGELRAPERLLLGPGPTNVHPRVYRAMMTPILGYLDPAFLDIMDEVSELLRAAFQTKNPFTLAISASGSAGMEAAVANLIEPGDEAVVVVGGFFGERLCEIVERHGGRPVKVSAPLGRGVELDAVEEALSRRRPKVLAAVHGETSTGTLQPLQPLTALAKTHGALTVVDAVATLGGCPVEVDRLGIDVCYSGSQKCLGAPPGLAPLTLSERAVEAIRARRSRPSTWYLDLVLLERYWFRERGYHHTAPATLFYALREALRAVLEEGLPARWERHRRASRALIAGLEAMGLQPLAEEAFRLPSVNAVHVPGAVSDIAVRRRLLREFGVEIGGGLGALRGKIWRIGLMGENAREGVVVQALEALERALRAEGFGVEPGVGVRAASESLSRG